MTTKEIGQYEEIDSGERFTVIELIPEAQHPRVNGPRQTLQNPLGDYKTTCGIDLEKLDDNLNEFEMIQRDGIIRRV